MAETITLPPSPSISVRTTIDPTPPKKSAKRASVSPSKKAESKFDKSSGITKPKQSKSRNGCITCKAKRLKCDETHPSCQNCAKRSVTCGGYKKDFKWRPFEETTFSNKPVPAVPGKAKKAPTTSFAAPAGGPLSPIFEAAQAAIIGQSPSTEGSSVPTPPASATPKAENIVTDTIVPPPSPHTSMPSPQFTVAPSEYFAPTLQNGVPDLVQSDSVSTALSCSFSENDAFSIEPMLQSSTSGQSPRLADLLLPGTDMSTPNPEYLPYMSQYPDAFQQPDFNQLPEIVMEDEDVEEIMRPELLDDSYLISPGTSSFPSTPLGSPGFWFPENPFKMFREPQFSISSPEMMTLRFDRQTCGILSVMDGPTENPWRTLIWPMARETPALYHAIASMTNFHVSKNQPNMRVQGLEHMRTSLSTLAAGIANMSLETAIATTLTLAFSESWDQHISTGIDHIKGAKVLVSQALTRHRQDAFGGEQLNRLKFLCNTWVYMDVIARLTSADEDDSNDFDTVYDMLPGISNSNAESELDPLMGCAQTLFPIIGRVANLVRKCRRCENNTPTMISHAVRLKTMLEEWVPSNVVEEPEDPTSQIQDCLQTAEAYRWATLLYLHQAVPEIPSLSSAELAERVMVYLATVPLSSRTVIIQIYPLMAAGCEAADEATRMFVRDRWSAMAYRMKIGVIDKCFEVTKEVWSRRDAYEAKQRRSVFTLPSSLPSSLKREYSSFDDDLDGAFDWMNGFDGVSNGKRRATTGANDLPRPMRLKKRRTSGDARLGTVDKEFTVRGSLHWLGVMRDWNWEVLLG